jgi:hypothetical protein
VQTAHHGYNGLSQAFYDKMTGLSGAFMDIALYKQEKEKIIRKTEELYSYLTNRGLKVCSHDNMVDIVLIE